MLPEFPAPGTQRTDSSEIFALPGGPPSCDLATQQVFVVRGEVAQGQFLLLATHAIA